MNHLMLMFVVLLALGIGISKRVELLETGAGGLQEAFTWSRLSYVISKIEPRKGRKYPKGTTEPVIVLTETNETANFIFENNVPMGANRWKNKLFITVPRRREGVISTLNYIPMHSIGQHNVPLIPYPDLETNRQVEPAEVGRERFVSVYRVAIDVCDRLWFVDIGRVQTTGNNRRIIPQNLVIMNLKTDKIIRRYNFKATDIAELNGFFSLTVDTDIHSCDDAYAYLPDSLGLGIVTYSFRENDSWRTEHPYFAPEPGQDGFSIGGIPVLFKDGVFSLSLTKEKLDGFRDVYFHAMIGIKLYKVSSRILRDRALATRTDHGDDFKIIGTRLANSQTTKSGLHQPSGLMFFAMVVQNAVGCWNSNFPFRANDFDVIYKDDVKMIYPCDLNIYKDDLIVMSNRFPIFHYAQLNYDEVNFRVFMNSVYDAVKNTKCGGYFPPI